MLHINYGVSRKIKGVRKIQFQTGKLQIEGDWDKEETHQAIKKKIQEANPGWNVAGYAWTNNPKE